MKFMYNGQEIGGPRGPAGPDGNPIGTVISFMGTSAPKDYLVCDGAAYNVADYPKLAEFFAEQFGEASHFGGDGTTTFAVPDMRNLFLRGYHGESEEQLSGEVGEKQEATQLPMLAMGEGGNLNWAQEDLSLSYWPQNADINIGITVTKGRYIDKSVCGTWADNSGMSPMYTARPVNMAVLYCIKAVESVLAENVYSTEETRIGTWMDKPLYRKIIFIQSGAGTNIETTVLDLSSIDCDSLTHVYGTLYEPGNVEVPVPQATSSAVTYSIYRRGNDLIERHLYPGASNRPMTVVLEYTKTTD